MDETVHAIEKLANLYPLAALAIEVARFDTQLLRNPGVLGEGYQQGPLHQSNLREYVLHRDGHRCRYCGRRGMVLNLDHVTPRSRGGATRGKAPHRYYDAPKSCFGFTTGDLVEADVPAGKKKGTYVGKVAIRVTGSLKVTTADGAIDGISHRCCRLVERGNGWSFFTQRRPALLPALTGGASAPEESR